MGREHQSDARFQLGDSVEDKISKFKGIVGGVAYHISGCERYGVYEYDNATNAGDKVWFFEGQLQNSPIAMTIPFEEEPETSVDFDVGWLVRDKITGIEGIVLTVTFSSYNCPEACVLPLPEEENPIERPDTIWIDAPLIEVVGNPSRISKLSSGAQSWLERVSNIPATQSGPTGPDESSQANDSR